MNATVRAGLTQRFPVPAERVYAAWLEPEWIGRWVCAPEPGDARVVRLDLEPRPGGRFSFVVNRRGMEIEHAGEYLALDPPHLLVFTWAMRDILPGASRVVVEISPQPGGCELMLTHVMAADWAVFMDQAAASWRRTLAALAGALSETSSLTLHSS